MKQAELIQHIERYIPNFTLRIYRDIKRYLLWFVQQIVYKHALSKVSNKKPLNVIYIVFSPSIWKYDSLFKLMLEDECFNPIVFVSTNEALGSDLKLDNLRETYSFFVNKGYRTICAYDEVTDRYVDMDTLCPDILFYSTPYPYQIPKQYNQYTRLKYLKCYVNYAYVNVIYSWSIASAVQGLMWLYFVECESNKQLALSYSKSEFQNARVVGYPIYDEYQATKGDTLMWKSADPKFKRIIWAPHHSIEGHNGLLSFSTFLENAEKILEFAENNKDKYQFAFKPHPLLLQALYNHPKWGKEKADAYYKSWEEGENTTLQTGTYMELFKSSDAMIHDCGSFIIEYLYTQKPVMYLGNSREEQSNVVGKKAYACHYHGTTIEEIDVFLDDVVQNGNDDLKTTRKQFYDEVLLPPNSCSVAENIINEIKRSIYG